MTFEEILFQGISKIDGGLFIPHYIPQLNINELKKQHLSFNELAFHIFRLFISEIEIPDLDLKNILNNSFKNFRVQNVVNIQKLDSFYLLELFHGPSYSFKDIALQVLSNMISYFLNKKSVQNKNTYILCATSGDTGSAAIQSVLNCTNLGCIVLFPNFGVSPIQKAQITTIKKDNILNFEVNGSFDDCQKMVKEILRMNNLEFNFISVNSINWTRILTQIVYYVWTYFYLNINDNDTMNGINFSVPTGNFGDILAGYYAYRMGIPIKKLIIATNENDILYQFMKTGEYCPKTVVSTLSPAMDISISSNFERLLWYAFYNKNDNVKNTCNEIQNLMNELNTTGKFNVKNYILESIKSIFECEKTNDNEIILEIKDIYKKNNYIIDPHTAVGINSYKKLNEKLDDDIITVCLSTAHPCKFPETINSALGDSFTSSLDYLLSLPQYYEIIVKNNEEIFKKLNSIT